MRYSSKNNDCNNINIGMQISLIKIGFINCIMKIIKIIK